MKVEQICTRPAKSCTPESTLADAGNLMGEADCGLLPVVDDAGRVVGVVTDRDICLALSLTGKPANQVPVRILLQDAVHTCGMGEGVRDALRTMRTRKVRRLPVVDGAGVLCGVISLGDVARAAKPERLAGPSDVTDEDLALALKTISGRAPAGTAVPAAATVTLV